ncbi:hypothetical protein QP938_04675 [Porticoccaceae bacterium LTM1]|nr:hypothetical protein QP938_04675 [Porticoccaceae bacterium LTM1]
MRLIFLLIALMLVGTLISRYLNQTMDSGVVTTPTPMERAGGVEESTGSSSQPVFTGSMEKARGVEDTLKAATERRKEEADK